MLAVIFGAALGYTAVVIYTKLKQRRRVGKASQPTLTQEAMDFVRRLDELGYFKYAKEAYIKNLKRELATHFDQYKELGSIYDDKYTAPLDCRHYHCDGETLWEEGGLLDTLKTFQPSFAHFGFRCEVTHHHSEWDPTNRFYNQTITLNGTTYVVFENFSGLGWGESAKRLAEILNTELALQGKDERLYLINGGNDGHVIFLTDALYRYLYTVLPNPMWKPLEVHEWAKVMQITSDADDEG